MNETPENNQLPMTAPASPFSLDALEREVEVALAAAGVFDIGSYGWLNEDDVDPEHVGHAMWQIDQPSLDFSAAFDDAPVGRRPRDLEKQVLTLGEDFCGLMQLSRLSIGLMLLWKDQTKRGFLNESPFFRLHHMDVYLKLAIASDRLRDLLVVACTGSAPEDYKTTKQRRRYVTPFNEAGEMLASRGIDSPHLTEPLEVLPALALAIFGFIDRRNLLVHSIATRTAKAMRDSVDELQRKYDHQQTHGFKRRIFDFEEMSQRSQSFDEDSKRELSSSIQELIDWYQLLIDASNHVFQVEYWSRSLSGSDRP